MALLDLASKANQFLVDPRHPISRDFYLLDPVAVLALFFGYLASVFLGKAVMQRQKPVDVGMLPLAHNLVCIVISVYIVVETVRQAILADYGLCNGLDISPKGVGMARVMWVFYASKVVEFMDTWIMVLKKNFRQISFLHMYHHSTIFLLGWFMASYAPNGETYFPCLQNSVVHVIMYSYYFITCLESYTKRSIINREWKFYITYVQLFQFAINIAHYIYQRVTACDGYPPYVQHIYFVYNLMMIVLFSNFLVRNKGAPKAGGKAEKDE